MCLQAEILTDTYYGEKARDSRKNPCKGDALTICGTKQHHLVEDANGGCTVTTVTKDDEGNILDQETVHVPYSNDEIIAYLMANIPDNVVRVIVPDSGAEQAE